MMQPDPTAPGGSPVQAAAAPDLSAVKTIEHTYVCPAHGVVEEDLYPFTERRGMPADLVCGIGVTDAAGDHVCGNPLAHHVGIGATAAELAPTGTDAVSPSAMALGAKPPVAGT